MAEITIEIPIVPRAQKRARSRIAGNGKRKFVQVYTDKDQRNEQENFKAFLFNQLPPGWTPIKGPIVLSVDVRMPIPPSYSAKKKELCRIGQIAHTGRPDCSNLIKHIEDCMNGSVFLDDKQIVGLHVTKVYSENPGWSIIITW